MKKLLLCVLFCLIFSLFVSAQKFVEPTKTSSEPTETQINSLNVAVEFYGERKFDEAIEIYQKILEENPDFAGALYEIGLSYYSKKDYPKALEYLKKGFHYKSPILADFYRLFGSVVDDQGDSKKALKYYEIALKLAPDDVIVHFDMGITHRRLENKIESRKYFKKTVELDFTYFNAHFNLAENFYKSNYRYPSMFAIGRYISLKPEGENTRFVSKIFKNILTSGVQTENDSGNLKIFINPDTPKDEGDFGSMELTISLLGASGVLPEKDTSKLSEEQKFVNSVKTLVNLIEKDKKNSATFIGKNYYPFYVELKKKDFVEPFAYLILQQTGNKNADKWFLNNSQKFLNFLIWAEDYQPPK